MSWFVDASAIVAILGSEDGWETIASRLDQDDDCMWSALSSWESSVALTKRLNQPLEETQRAVIEFAEYKNFRLVPIAERESVMAIQAATQYGKGSGHPAKLNMGDCFAYACAKANNARLLYKGDDFARTDLA